MATCVKQTNADVDTAVQLLQRRSKWFTEYGNLIKNSQWYAKYGDTLKAKASECRSGKVKKQEKKLQKVKKKEQQTAKEQKKEEEEEKKAETKKKKKEEFKPKPAPPVKPATSPTVEKDKIDAALKKAQHALAEAKTKDQDKVARAAVDSALKKAGVKDSKNAGTIAWANHQLDLAKKWAEEYLQHQVKALDKVAGWTEGARKEGKKKQKATEDVIQTMIAVAQATKNAEQIAQEHTDRDQTKMKAMQEPIKRTREAADAAEKSVQHAKAALAVAMSTQTRIQAKHALDDAKDALRDANAILQSEVGRRNAILANRLHSDGAKLVGESELHYRARKTFHRGQRVLKLVDHALLLARKNHYAHKKALQKREQKAVAEKAAKLAFKEKSKKSEERRKARGIKTEEEYAAKLADEALDAGKRAGTYMGKAAEAGRLAAAKILEAAEVKASLYKEQHKGATHKAVTAKVKEESGAAVLASKASRWRSQHC